MHKTRTSTRKQESFLNELCKKTKGVHLFINIFHMIESILHFYDNDDDNDKNF